MELTLNLIIWLPVVAAACTGTIPTNKGEISKWISLVISILNLILVVSVLWQSGFVYGQSTVTFTESRTWIPMFNIFYRIGFDGQSLSMLLLSGILFPIAIASSWGIQRYTGALHAMFLVLMSSVNGVFISQDLFLFFIFWEFMLVPMYFLIAIWGGENKEYAAFKFFLYTFFASIFLLLAIIVIYIQSGQGPDSFNLLALKGGIFKGVYLNLFGEKIGLEGFLFLLFFIAFAVKLPVVPFHTWLPHAHVQAPTGVSVLLAGVLLKLGGYGFLRIALPIVPNAFILFSKVLAILGVINIVYGGYCALAQSDLKKMVAYSSVAHMGFILLGISSMSTLGLVGAYVEMFSHGMSSASLFLLVGFLSYQANHRWLIKPDGTKGFGGLFNQTPRLCFIFALTIFASMGLPGLSGFIGECLVLISLAGKYPGYLIMTSLGLLLGATYLILAFIKIFWGESATKISIRDLRGWELMYLAPLCILMVFIGVFPQPLINLFESSLSTTISFLGQ